MIKHIEIKTYEYMGVNITVKIDYDAKDISLVEGGGGPECSATYWVAKKWIFAGRTLDYMVGWQNILDAMKYAIEEASGELESYLKSKEKEKEDEVTDVLMEATNIIQKRNGKKGKSNRTS
jgi:hypothetical protein